MTPLISEKISNQLDLIIQKANEINRLLDRQMSLLTIKFSMKRTSEILHPIHAHFFSLIIADKVNGYKEKRSNDTVYLGTGDNFGNCEYGSPLELFQDSFNLIIDLESLINETITMSIEEEDYSTVSFLYSLLLLLNEDIDLAQTLIGLVSNCNDNYVLLDGQIDDLIEKNIFILSNMFECNGVGVK
ncbi:MAG: hypothetical protein PHO86_04695 [Bacilli bacterium]|nr:hypothetical protein [Bacilli bacterium]